MNEENFLSSSAQLTLVLFQLTGLKLGPEKYLEREGPGEQSDSWTTVSLTSSLHTSHSTPAQNKKGKT